VVYVALKTAGGAIKPYTLQETLPKMVSDFGAKARVVQISVSEDDVDFQVMGGDEQLHIRNYDVVESEISAGTEGYNQWTGPAYTASICRARGPQSPSPRRPRPPAPRPR
jgi:hypothetical protein